MRSAERLANIMRLEPSSIATKKQDLMEDKEVTSLVLHQPDHMAVR
jgi:hypothetical protein